jgi:predicted nucleic acid-binding protein
VLDALRGATWLSVADDPALEALGLDPGETAAILLAGAVAAEVLRIDERRGRAVAVARGLHVIGTLGVLVGARRAGALDRVAPVIAELRADGFSLSDAVSDAVLEQVGERG